MHMGLFCLLPLLAIISSTTAQVPADDLECRVWTNIVNGASAQLRVLSLKSKPFPQIGNATATSVTFKNSDAKVYLNTIYPSKESKSWYSWASLDSTNLSKDLYGFVEVQYWDQASKKQISDTWQVNGGEKCRAFPSAVATIDTNTVAYFIYP